MELELWEINTFDFWLFGSLKNFQAGIDTFRDPKFPPDIVKFFHLLDLEEAFPIGVFLKKENEIYFPVPADILQPRKGEKGKLKVSPLISKEKLNKEFLKENSSEVFLTDREDLDILPFIKESETKYEGASGYISFEKIKKKARIIPCLFYIRRERVDLRLEDLLVNFLL